MGTLNALVTEATCLTGKEQLDVKAIAAILRLALEGKVLRGSSAKFVLQVCSTVHDVWDATWHTLCGLEHVART